MSGNIRIGQNLREGYNPDGLPGTVSLGAGSPGRAPTSEEIQAAVAEHIRTNPLPVQGTNATTSETIKVGTGALGSAGAYLEMGTFGTIDTRVAARSTAPSVNLYLEASGQVISDSMLINGSLNVRETLTLNDQPLYLRGIGSDEAISFRASEDPTQAGIRVSTSSSGDLTVHSLITGDQNPVLQWHRTGITVTGRQFISGVHDNIGVPITLTGALAEVRSATAVQYETLAGDQARTLPIDQLNGALTEGGYVEPMGLIATLWNALREMETRRKIGSTAATTNGSGDIVVVHSLGTTPTAIFIQNRILAGFQHTFTVHSVTATQMTVRVHYNGAITASSAQSFYWRVEGS